MVIREDLFSQITIRIRVVKCWYASKNNRSMPGIYWDSCDVHCPFNFRNILFASLALLADCVNTNSGLTPPFPINNSFCSRILMQLHLRTLSASTRLLLPLFVDTKEKEKRGLSQNL